MSCNHGALFTLVCSQEGSLPGTFIQDVFAVNRLCKHRLASASLKYFWSAVTDYQQP